MPRCAHPTAVVPRIEASGPECLLWVDDGWRPRSQWFDPAWYRREGLDRGEGAGRGAALYAELQGRPLVLRHYRRGGAMRERLGDRYLWCGLRASRPWRELALLARLHAEGLPVPAPVAARVQRLPPPSPFYCADLLTERLAHTRTLTQALSTGPLAEAVWRALGATIARFHLAGVEHADLNAHNVLLGADDAVYLIDFDRGRLRRNTGRWCQRNIERLHRSLTKLSGLEPGFHFNEDAWAVLQHAWKEAVSSAPSPR